MNSRNEAIEAFKAAIDANQSFDAIDVFDAYSEYLSSEENKGKEPLTLESPVFPGEKTAIEYAVSVGNIDLVRLMVSRPEIGQETKKSALAMAKQSSANLAESVSPGIDNQKKYGDMIKLIQENIGSPSTERVGKLKSDEASKFSKFVNKVSMQRAFARNDKKDKIKDEFIASLSDIATRASTGTLVEEVFKFKEKNKKAIEKAPELNQEFLNVILSKINNDTNPDQQLSPAEKIKILSEASLQYRDSRETTKVSESASCASIMAYRIDQVMKETIKELPGASDTLQDAVNISSKTKRDDPEGNARILPDLMSNLEQCLASQNDQPAIAAYLMSDIANRLNTVKDPALKDQLSARLAMADQKSGLNPATELNQEPEMTISKPVITNDNAEERKASIEGTRQAMQDLVEIQKMIDKIGDPNFRISETSKKINDHLEKFESKHADKLKGDSPIAAHYNDIKSELNEQLALASKINIKQVNAGGKIRNSKPATAAVDNAEQQELNEGPSKMRL